MSAHFNPKLELFKFSLNPNNISSCSFKDFIIKKLALKNTISDQDAFRALFEYFMRDLNVGVSLDEKNNKVISLPIDSVNRYKAFKPIIKSKTFVFEGVISGGKYNERSILMDVTNKQNSSEIKNIQSIQKYHYIFVYMPPKDYEGYIMVHNNNMADSITSSMKKYLERIFLLNGYYKKIKFERYCPDEIKRIFQEGLTLQSISYSTRKTNDIISNNTIIDTMNGFSVKVQFTPKDQTLTSCFFEPVANMFKQLRLSLGNKGKELSNFERIQVTASNHNLSCTKTYDLYVDNNNVIPVINLEDKVTILADGTPDFNELRQYCEKIFETNIKTESSLIN